MNELILRPGLSKKQALLLGEAVIAARKLLLISNIVTMGTLVRFVDEHNGRTWSQGGFGVPFQTYLNIHGIGSYSSGPDPQGVQELLLRFIGNAVNALGWSRDDARIRTIFVDDANGAAR